MAFTPAIREFLAIPDDARRLGPYRCKGLLDKAGQAPVFRATEEHAGLSLREVAIKVFDIGKTSGKTGDSRILDEARSLCRVQHPNVIRFHTLSTDPQRGLMGIVMEYAEGVSVEKKLEKLPKDDTARIALAVEVGLDISAALAAAHQSGVVHCNVKPSNIMFTNGTHKLINFGIAASMQPVDEEDEDGPKRESLFLDDLAPESIGRNAATLATKAGSMPPIPVAGTIGYVDPVCLKTTSQPTASSDLYSLGATLYHVITGDVPAVVTAKKKGESGVDKTVLLGEAPATPLLDVAPATPPELAKLVDTLIAPAREKRPRAAEAVHRTLERIRSALAGHERSLPSEDRGPFPGLERYEASDRDVFFGRSAEIAGVIELLRTRGLVGIVGLSGAGKSSITRAGLLPAIQEGALGGWPKKYRSIVATPGSDLMASLDGALSKMIDEKLADHPEAIAEQLAANVDKTGEGIVILVDQLEEIVVKHDKKKDAERLKALELLSRLAEAHVGLRVIVCIRRDLLDGTLAIDGHFARALSRGIQLLAPLTITAWGEVLDQALEAYDYRFEDGDLRRDVLAEIKERESAMTLIQFGLTKLWANRDKKKNTLTHAGLNDKGGMKAALGEHADAAIASLKLPREKVREVLLSMTTPEGHRAHVPLERIVEQFGEEAKEAVFAMTKARLVASETPGFTFVHDSILRDWKLLRGWIEEARDDRMVVAHVERDAARWIESRDPAELWRKGRLASGLDVWKRGVPLSDAARQFLTKSSNEEAKSRIAFWTMAAILVTLIVGGSLIYAKQSQEAAHRAQRDAETMKDLKRQADESAAEAQVSAQLLADLQRQMEEERAASSKNVQTALKKIATATDLGAAQKATEDLKKESAPKPHPAVAGLDLSGLGGGSPNPSGGAVFDQRGIENVVNTRKAGVKRTCLDRGSSTASSTKVTATLTIAPNGTVQNVTTTGNDPAVAKCIETQTRTWTFPPPGEVKQVQIPFVFVRQ